MRATSLTTLATILTLGLTGPALAQDAAEGEMLYSVFCAGCHGAGAEGDGEIAKILTVPPADLTQLEATNADIFPIERVAYRIDGRDPYVAHGGPMPLFGNFFDSPQVSMKTHTGQPILMGQGIADLIAYLQTIQD
ncbi:MAG: cytochrome c [Pseudomonadota bacterium]